MKLVRNYKSLTMGRDEVFASVKFQLNVCFLHNFVKIGILSTFLEIPAQPLFYRIFGHEEVLEIYLMSVFDLRLLFR